MLIAVRSDVAGSPHEGLLPPTVEYDIPEGLQELFDKNRDPAGCIPAERHHRRRRTDRIRDEARQGT